MSLSNDDIKQLISILQRGLVNDSTSEINDLEISQPEKSSKTHNPKSTKSRRVARSGQESYNKFESMPEKNMHKDDTRIDKILSQHAPTERSRQFDLVNVTCRVCGRKDEISSSLIYDSGNRYKCNKCSSDPG